MNDIQTFTRYVPRGTDCVLTLQIPNVDITGFEFALDIAYQNTRSGEFAVTRYSDTLVLLKLTRDKTALLPLGTHKGDLLCKDESNLVHLICKFEFEVLPNRTDFETHNGGL